MRFSDAARFEFRSFIWERVMKAAVLFSFSLFLDIDSVDCFAVFVVFFIFFLIFRLKLFLLISLRFY